MEYKFVYNGIKNVKTGELSKAWYSKGCHRDGEDIITIFAESYKGLLRINGLIIENDTDFMTDYFEKDRIEVKPDNKFYKQVFEAWALQEKHRNKLLIRRYEKEIDKCKNRLACHKGIERYEEYYGKILEDLNSRYERVLKWQVF